MDRESAETPTARLRPSCRGGLALLGIVVAGALAAGGCGGGSDSSGSTPVPQPTAADFAAAGLAKLPVAPESKRADLNTPPFSDPTNVTNPLFPISDLHSVVLNGHIEGKPFHTETTLMPYTRTFQWGGKPVETLVSQYVAFIDGRIYQSAIDYYAQGDDGAVWYFGEEASSYNKDGVIAFTSETWLAGKDGPPAMIMPGDPTVGDTYRPENIPGLTFEEVSVKSTGRTRAGPAGPIDGVMVARELHDEGSYSNKVFAPGYGEFFTHEGTELEALALAVPTDALGAPPPAELKAVSSGADNALAAVQSKRWAAASAAARTLSASWDAFRKANQVPPRLEPPLSQAIADLSASTTRRDQERAGTAAIDVAQAALDIELRYLPPDQVDLERFGQWDRQIIVDARAGNLAGVSGDLATMELTRDRFTDSLHSTDLARIDSQLVTLRDNVDNKDLSAARAEAARLQNTLAGLRAAS